MPDWIFGAVIGLLEIKILYLLSVHMLTIYVYNCIASQSVSVQYLY